LSKPAASKGWVCVFCFVSFLAIVAIALLTVSPARRPAKASGASLSARAATGMPAARTRIQASYAALPLAFEPNQGQTDSEVKYLARGNGYTLFLTGNDAVFALHSLQAEPSKVRRSAFMAKSRRQNRGVQYVQKELSAVVRMQLAGGNSSAKVQASGQLPGASNYFIGNDPAKWRSDVAHYARVSYQDVYPGVNLAFHGAQRQVEFDFVVAPEADATPVGFHFTGAQGIKTDGSGNLVIASAAGDVLLHKPLAYQEQNGMRQAVDARFLLKAKNQVSFELGSYDHSRELVIDPSVTYSDYLGGSAEDDGRSIAFDSSGNAYVTGETESANFPVAGGVPPNASAGSSFDVFVTKIAADGSTLGYSTYVGGSGTGKGDDSGNAIAVNTSGGAFVAGGTASANFPTTAGAFQTALGSSSAVSNAFVFELNSAGNALTYSTYLGGTDNDFANGIALDGSGNSYVAGFASSNDFPTLNPIQTYPGGANNGFVTKLNSTGSALLYSTYLALGGAVGDSVNGVALDSSHNAYLTGVASSSAFQTTSGAFQTTCGCSGGATDAFVTVINAAGSGYIYSTFLGGSQSDTGNAIAVDSSGSAYVTGDTESSTDFPTTTGVFQATYGGATDAFVAKLNPAGSALVYSSYLGGSAFDVGVGIAVDASDYAYITGQTVSTNFPTASPTQASLNGGNNTVSTDAFVTEVNPAGSELVFSTYLGGSADDDGSVGSAVGAIAADGPGANIYVTGNTASSNFPTQSPFTGGGTYGGNTDAFVVKYAQGPSFTITATTPGAVSPGGSGMSTVTLTSFRGYNSTVSLSCSVSGSGSPLPGCSASSFSPDQVTPTTSGAASTLTITTTGSSSALFAPRKLFYAMWLPIAGMSLVGMSFGSARSRRKKILGFLVIGMIMATLLVLPACGGSSGGGGGGGGGGTPAGSYTVTITGTGTDANMTTASTQVTLTVN